jgi:predicted phage tail protein
MNLKNWARRALVVVAVTTSLAAAGQAQADSGVPTPSPTTGTVLATAVVATAPRSPTATPGHTTVKLAWLAPSSNGGATINQYRVQRATSAKGPWTTVAKPAVRRFRAGGLKNGTRYYFRIAAHNAAGWSTPSKIVSAVPRTVPTVPRSPTATPGNTTVKLVWLAPSSNGGAKINTYRVQRATSATGPWTTIAKPTIRSYTAGGLKNGTRYYFRVAAHNAAGWGAPSKVVNAVPRAVPGAPLSPKVTLVSNGDVMVTWTPPSSSGVTAIDQYAVQWATSPGGLWSSIDSIGSPGYTMSGLTLGTNYYLRVRAHNAAGWGPASTIVTAVPRTVPGPVPACTAAQINQGSKLITVDWHRPASDGGAPIGSYYIEIRKNAKFYYSYEKPNDNTNHALVTVFNDTSEVYEILVSARNPAGLGPACGDTVIVSM